MGVTLGNFCAAWCCLAVAATFAARATELAVEAAASSSKNSSPLDSDARPRTPDRDGADDVEEVPRRWAPPPKLVLEARHEEPRSSMFAPM